MTLAHAVYGSTTGLGDFGILASTAGLDERVRSTIIYYANLEGSARSTPFAPIFSFYALGDKLWAFSRTLCLGSTRRGNDYLVHAIVLDAAALARIDYRPFALAGLFMSSKPSEGTVLKPLSIEGGSRRAFRFDNAAIASCIRALSRGPLRLRMEDDVQAAEVCREIHDSLPPDDRIATTFCTRFSYGRKLGFQLAAFASADEPKVRETAAGATIVDFPSPTSTLDHFDRWTAEIRGQNDLDLIGLSVVSDAREAFALIEGVRQLRRWTAHDATPDITALEKASALVLRKENRGREVLQAVLPGALAVDLAARVRGGTAFEECARLCAELQPNVRRAAVEWLRELKTSPAELWMAEMLLLLPDAPLAEISAAWQRMQVGNANAFRAFATIVLGRIRDRFGAEGASVAASAASRLTGDALLGYVRVMEETAARDTAWLLAIVREVFSKGGIAPAIPARIILTNELLSSIDDAEVETFAPAFFVMEEKLANTLAATQRPALYRALVKVAQSRLREGWTPQTPTVLQRVLLGGMEAGADNSSLTVITFLGATMLPAQDVMTAIEHLVDAGVTNAQAALLVRTLQLLGRRGAKNVHVRRATLVTLLEAARKRPPQSLWNRLGWYLRMRTLTEVAR
jgi:GTPase-associated protein 1, N-terminal domain type 2